MKIFSFYSLIVSVVILLFASSFSLASDSNESDDEIHFLALSDVHVSTDVNTYPEMQAKTNLLPYIKDWIDTYKVKVFLMPGDLTTGKNKETLDVENCEIFKTRWYDLILNYLPEINVTYIDNDTNTQPKDRNFKCLLVTCGNHDFDAKCSGHYPKIIDFINETYGVFNPLKSSLSKPRGREMYRYAVKVNGLLFISLGWGPRGGHVKESDRGWLRGAHPENGANHWLKTYLKNLNIDKKQPIVLFFHVPVIDNATGFMKEKDMKEFYDIIKNYNIKALIVGHNHGNSSLNFCPEVGGKSFWQLDVSGVRFLHATYHIKTDTLEAEFVYTNADLLKMSIETPWSDHAFPTYESDYKNKKK